MKSAPVKDSLGALAQRYQEEAWAEVAVGRGVQTADPCADPAITAQAIGRRFRALSPREVEVCSLVARRLSTAEIAACLFISPRTVEKHVEIIFDKLDAGSREQLRWRLGVLPGVGRDAI